MIQWAVHLAATVKLDALTAPWWSWVFLFLAVVSCAFIFCEQGKRAGPVYSAPGSQNFSRTVPPTGRALFLQRQAELEQGQAPPGSGGHGPPPKSSGYGSLSYGDQQPSLRYQDSLGYGTHQEQPSLGTRDWSPPPSQQEAYLKNPNYSPFGMPPSASQSQPFWGPGTTPPSTMVLSQPPPPPPTEREQAAREQGVVVLTSQQVAGPPGSRQFSPQPTQQFPNDGSPRPVTARVQGQTPPGTQSQPMQAKPLPPMTLQQQHQQQHAITAQEQLRQHQMQQQQQHQMQQQQYQSTATLPPSQAIAGPPPSRVYEPPMPQKAPQQGPPLQSQSTWTWPQAPTTQEQPQQTRAGTPPRTYESWPQIPTTQGNTMKPAEQAAFHYQKPQHQSGSMQQQPQASASGTPAQALRRPSLTPPQERQQSFDSKVSKGGSGSSAPSGNRRF